MDVSPVSVAMRTSIRKFPVPLVQRLACRYPDTRRVGLIPGATYSVFYRVTGISSLPFLPQPARQQLALPLQHRIGRRRRPDGRSPASGRAARRGAARWFPRSPAAPARRRSKCARGRRASRSRNTSFSAASSRAARSSPVMNSDAAARRLPISRSVSADQLGLAFLGEHQAALDLLGAASPAGPCPPRRRRVRGWWRRPGSRAHAAMIGLGHRLRIERRSYRP